MTEAALPTGLMHCPNCQTAYPQGTNFCPNCGQDTHSHRVPIKHFIMEFLEGTFHFDHKVFGTLKSLMVNPGQLARDFNENKRARYVPPIRLYIFISFIFFFLLSSGLHTNMEELTSAIRNKQVSMDTSTRVTLNDGIDVRGPVLKQLVETPQITVEQTARILEENKVKTNRFTNKLLTKLVHIRRGELTGDELGHQVLSAISKMVFVLMPLFAFLVWLYCGRRKMYYSEGLIFSLYFHCFYFILLTLGVLLGKIIHIPYLFSYLFLIACFYLVISVRTAFSKRWSKAVLQSMLLVISYSILFGMAFILAILASIIM